MLVFLRSGTCVHPPPMMAQARSIDVSSGTFSLSMAVGRGAAVQVRVLMSYT